MINLIVAGQFYEEDEDKLRDQIKKCFKHEQGPGDLPVKERKGKIFGAISPHAGYMFSGPAMAWGYKAIAEAEFPDLFIILGPSHMGFDTCTSLDDWKTPLGTVMVDKEFTQKLIDNGINHNPKAHTEEHSIEVQLPFLQFVSEDNKDKLKIVPILINDNNYEETAAIIEKTIKETEKNVMIITSSDFTHYGKNYGYTPFVYSIKKNLHELDGGAINQIKKLDVHKFMQYCKEKDTTICGKLPIAVLIELAFNISNDAKVELLQYYHSGDLVGDYSNSVGYASIVVRE